MKKNIIRIDTTSYIYSTQDIFSIAKFSSMHYNFVIFVSCGSLKLGLLSMTNSLYKCFIMMWQHISACALYICKSFLKLPRRMHFLICLRTRFSVHEARLPGARSASAWGSGPTSWSTMIPIFSLPIRALSCWTPWYAAFLPSRASRSATTFP